MWVSLHPEETKSSYLFLLKSWPESKMANCSFNKVCLGPVHRKAYAPNPPKTAIKFVFLAAVFKNLGLYRFKMV